MPQPPPRIPKRTKNPHFCSQNAKTSYLPNIQITFLLNPLKPPTVLYHSETALKPHGFRPLWNPSETITGRLGMALEKPYVAKHVVGTDFIQFRAAIWFKTNHADISEPSFTLWNPSETMTGRLGMALEKPYVAKQVVGTWFHPISSRHMIQNKSYRHFGAFF